MSSSQTFVECPNCGERQEDLKDRRSANNFCSECDYPIFFDTQNESGVDATTDWAARNRSPGVEGRSKQNWRDCPVCGEKNERELLHCVRCGAVLLVADRDEVVDETDEPELDEEFAFPNVVITNPGLITGVIAGLLAGLIIGFFVGSVYF